MTVLSNGDVRPCCYTTVIAGNLFRQSFDEVWNGEVYTAMRAAFARGEMPKYCQLENGSCSRYHEFVKDRKLCAGE